MTTQTQLAVIDLALIPMVNVGTAIYLLRRFEFDEDDIAGLVGDGRLVGWDIAAPRAERRELRLWAPSIERFAERNFGRPALGEITFQWAEIVQTLLRPSNQSWVVGTEVQFALNCSSTHVIGLIEHRPPVLKLMPGTSYQTGRNGSPKIARDSFVNFLTNRLETAHKIRGLF
jgi:hypothetical protein